MSNLAGIVAEQLIEGYKCPVCGSIEHPDIAHRCEDSLTKEDLENLQKDLEIITLNAQKAQSRTDRQMAKVEQLHKNIMERVSKYGITEDTQVKEQVSKMKYSLAEEYTTIHQEIKLLQKTAEDVRNIQDGLNSLKISISNIETTITNKQTQLENTSNEYTHLKEEYFKLLAEHSIQDEKTHQNLINDYGRCGALECQVQSYHVEKSKNLQLLDDYSKLVGDNVLIDTTELNSRLINLNAQRDTLMAQSKLLKSDLQTNINIYTEVSSMVDTLEKYHKRYRDTEYLSGVANGTLSSGNGKVSFDGYVQAYYFEQVLERANHKIQTMSSGRYTLTRKEVATGNSTRTNLDIEVFDAYTCTKRSASTLSGGESFMASLSLALGLSEIVQNNSGGIQIDAMFIDEGFGTLDSDLSLQQAMKILDDLAQGERVVGIISHVGDLQEHINRKLYVEKTPDGSFVRNGF
jgi:exonuclease SbcC